MNLKKYQEAIEQSNIVSKTDLDGIITFVNDEFCKISGYKREELIGENHNIIRHPDVPKDVFEKLWNTIKEKKAYISTVKNKAKNGSTFYVNTTVIPMLNEKGTIEEFIAIRYDVTDSIELTEKLKQKEEELENLNITLEQRVKEQTQQLLDLNQTLELRIKEEVEKNRDKDRFLFQQSRLAAMGEMIGNIAHQWRQPLSELGIILYTMKKIFKNTNVDDKEFLKSYESSKKVIKKMSETIEDFRNFFNPHRPIETFSIKNALDEAMLIMQGTLQRHEITLKVDCYDEVSIKGYLSEFSQVLINLLNNSKDAFNKYSVDNRVINLEINKIEDNYAIISFKDNAGGIEKEVLDKIFEPYFTTKHASMGTGLGLYMSRMIIQNSMSGTLEAENCDDGMCFYIKVPCVDKENIDG
ncbi:PAS domain-containing sensor histidine kinase [Sulfurospirillum arcachonense]|uniref:PAS domain-containing sensor histidine kinase n=1 Tax=Sulfurospirillum arcachonense TaxID=57666 RepID=UPI00046A0A36|nr:PAS domain-containing sensor histidine kinase [Sulfurospirillum arcachonense]